MALKLARVATGRFKFISMWDSFHGASLDAISVGGEAMFRNGIGPLLPGCEHVPPPGPSPLPVSLRRVLQSRLVPTTSPTCSKGTGRGGGNRRDRSLHALHPASRLLATHPRRLRRARRLLILDEIPIGFGRTGRMFACEHYDIVPRHARARQGTRRGRFPRSPRWSRAKD